MARCCSAKACSRTRLPSRRGTCRRSTRLRFSGGASRLPGSGGLEIVFEPDSTIWDGRFSNNAWLQELPKPLTKLTWDNAACLSPDTAARLGLNTDDVVDVKLRGRSVQAPFTSSPASRRMWWWYRWATGARPAATCSTGSGYNAYAIRTQRSALVRQRRGGEQDRQNLSHWRSPTNTGRMENRDLIRAATLEEYQANPNFAQEGEVEPPHAVRRG